MRTGSCRIFLLCLGCLLCALAAYGQTTKLRGQVLDAQDGSPIPFVSVFFKGTQIGTSTDNEGYFYLNTKDLQQTELTAYMLGYRPETIKIRAGAFSNVIFFLQPEHSQLDEAVVKADNRRIRKLLSDIEAHKARNNPEQRSGYECDVYSKLEMDLTHPREQLKSKAVKKQWNFIFDYVDTSDVSGIPYLPILINESVSKRYHSKDPDLDREVITARRLSGAEPDDNLLSQFTGSMMLKNNFYDSYIDAFNIRIPSPINSAGLVFYNYYIIDTLQMDGRKTYMVRYHPREGISTPAFDGEMFIDASEFALRRVKARLAKGQNMNWVRDMVLEAEYVRGETDSSWFYGEDRFYADFSLVMSDSSKLISFIGNRTVNFKNPVFAKPDITAAKTPVSVKEDAGMQDEEYWSSARPYALSEKEQNIYGMVERLQHTKLYNTLYDIITIVVNGYYDIGPVGIGPYHKIISFNPLEGFRLRAGVRTSNDWSKKDRIGAYVAYGFQDKQFKGGVTWEHMFGKEPTRKLTLDAHYDVLQLGRGNSKFNDGNILSSIAGAGVTQKLCPITEASVLYDHEFSSGFNTAWHLMFREYHENSFVPMVTPGGEALRSVYAPTADITLRFSRDETVIRGPFIKTYTFSKYPVFTLLLDGGVSILNPWDKEASCAGSTHAYFKPQLSMDWRVSLPPAGRTKLHLDVGTVVGKVPYTMLHLHEGNGTMLLDKSSFSCMDFFEFASDSWVTLMWEHNFYGFFLGKIPFIKKLQLREAVVLKTTWGHLSERNDGTGTKTDSQALVTFPQGMHSLGSVPYVEAGFAITNILRLLRVDFIWRCTHREDSREHFRNFMVNLGLELKF